MGSRNFLKLDSENAALYEFPQECLNNGNKPGLRNGSSKPGTTYEEPYLMPFMKELLNIASPIDTPDRPEPVIRFVTDKLLWRIWKVCCLSNEGDSLFASVLAKTYDTVLVGPDVKRLFEHELEDEPPRTFAFIRSHCDSYVQSHWSSTRT